SRGGPVPESGRLRHINEARGRDERRRKGARVDPAPDQRGALLAAVKLPSTSETFRSASRTLVVASTCRLNWLLSGGVTISSLWYTPTVQATLRSRREIAMRVSTSRAVFVSLCLVMGIASGGPTAARGDAGGAAEIRLLCFGPSPYSSRHDSMRAGFGIYLL